MTGGDDEPALLYDLVKVWFLQLQERLERGLPKEGALTGLAAFDRTVRGFRPGEVLTIVGARGAGKTQLALELACGAASTIDGRTFGALIVSSVSAATELTAMLVCGTAGLEMARVHTTNLVGESWGRLIEAADAVSQLPIWIDELATDERIAQRCDALRRKSGERLIRLVVIDELETADLRARVAELRVLAAAVEATVLAVVALRGPAPLHDPDFCLAVRDGRVAIVESRYPVERELPLRLTTTWHEAPEDDEDVDFIAEPFDD